MNECVLVHAYFIIVVIIIVLCFAAGLTIALAPGTHYVNTQPHRNSLVSVSQEAPGPVSVLTAHCSLTEAEATSIFMFPV